MLGRLDNNSFLLVFVCLPLNRLRPPSFSSDANIMAEENPVTPSGKEESLESSRAKSNHHLVKDEGRRKTRRKGWSMLPTRMSGIPTCASTGTRF